MFSTCYMDNIVLSFFRNEVFHNFHSGDYLREFTWEPKAVPNTEFVPIKQT